MKHFVFLLLVGLFVFATGYFVWGKYFWGEPPLISVVISGQNMASSITQAINSIQKQTFSRWELIVVDDASSDRTATIVSDYAGRDKRIFMLKNNVHQGQGYSLNEAVKKAKGKYIAFLDPKHTAYPIRLDRQYLFMENNTLDLSAGAYDTTESKYRNKDLFFPEEHNQDLLKIKLLFQNVFPYSTSIIRKDFLLKNDINYDLQYRDVPEYDLWLKIVTKGGKIALMGGKPIVTVPIIAQVKSRWKAEEKETGKIRQKLLEQIGFEDVENLENISVCDFYRQMIDLNNYSKYVDISVLSEYAMSQCIPSLKFEHPLWTDHLIPLAQPNTYQRFNNSDTAQAQLVSDGVLLTWENSQKEYFRCVKNVCALAPLPAGNVFHKGLNARSTDLHVFLEAYATNPALLQMIQYVQLPKNVRKLIAWHRFPNRAQHVNLALNNTREVPLMEKEGYWVDATKRMLKATKEEMDKDPNLMLVLHANLRKYDTVISYFLNEIPKERIRHIHLYEDGVGELFKAFEHYQGSSREETEKVLKGEEKPKSGTVFGLNYFYPTTIYFFEWKIAQVLPRIEYIINNIKHADIQDVDFDYYRRKLTQEQKALLYQLMGFDYKYWSNLLKDKKSVMFTMGFHFGDKRKEAAERAILHRLRSDADFSGLDASEYIWLYKPHPSFDAKTALPLMRKEFPDMIEVPAQIPFEIFVLADLKPTKVAGYSSSLFYVMEEPEILYFIQRGPNDGYLKFLKEVKYLNNNKILNLSDYMKEEEKK